MKNQRHMHELRDNAPDAPQHQNQDSKSIDHSLRIRMINDAGRMKHKKTHAVKKLYG